MTPEELLKALQGQPKAGMLNMPPPQLQVADGAAPPANTYPTAQDAAFARDAGFGYGTDLEPFIQNKAARVLGHVEPSAIPQKVPPSEAGQFVPSTTMVPRSLDEVTAAINDNSASRMLDLQRPDNKAIADKLKDHFAKAAIVINKMPIAALGFDPGRTGIDVNRKDSNIAGAYSPKDDTVYSNMTMPANLVHESIHRGMEQLRKSRPDLAGEFRALPNEEYIVRHLMATSPHGDLEVNHGDLGEKQRQAAALAFNPSLWGSARATALEQLTKAAQDEIHRRGHKMGPR